MLTRHLLPTAFCLKDSIEENSFNKLKQLNIIVKQINMTLLALLLNLKTLKLLKYQQIRILKIKYLMNK